MPSTCSPSTSKRKKEEAFDVDEMYRSVALYRQDSFDENEVRLSRLFVLFRFACLALVMEILAWLIDFATG